MAIAPTKLEILATSDFSSSAWCFKILIGLSETYNKVRRYRAAYRENCLIDRMHMTTNIWHFDLNDWNKKDWEQKHYDRL